ncbi:MAG: hypothetical protein GZ085_01990 [Sulfuriferula multivorans]|uniref:DUF4175 domain-containing protein n=1 Tax=Sulfuriferula multivorans TaxID=1559896 RepID=A0A7C9NSU0_9PROT|nr:hypothetical protein [Sulfuriferula multivorans]
MENTLNELLPFIPVLVMIALLVFWLGHAGLRAALPTILGVSFMFALGAWLGGVWAVIFALFIVLGLVHRAAEKRTAAGRETDAFLMGTMYGDDN